MTKDRIQYLVVGLVVLVLAGSSLGYLFVPSSMLRIVGMDGDAQSTFLLRTPAAAFVALIPIAWSARRRSDGAGQRSILYGLATYMFVSSLVDLHAFLNDIVGMVSIPSITLRVLLGAVLVWLVPTSHRVDRPRG